MKQIALMLRANRLLSRYQRISMKSAKLLKDYSDRLSIQHDVFQLNQTNAC